MNFNILKYILKLDQMYTFLFVTLLSILKVQADATLDLGVLNYALTLENLESAFYTEGLKNFTESDFKSFPDWTFNEFQRIANHEKVHVSTLISVINATYPNKWVPPCQYSFNVSNVVEFVATARALERTGVSAYLGRVGDLENKAYLSAAGTIVTIEARHASFLNVISGISGTPEAFDTPLDAKSIVSIASQFIVSCPYDLGGTYPKLTANVDDSLKVTLFYESKNTTDFCEFKYGANTKYVEIQNNSCHLPKDAYTDTYLFIVDGVNSTTVLAGPTIVSLKLKTKSNVYSKGQTVSLSSGLLIATILSLFL
jgi:rubrerythrin